MVKYNREGDLIFTTAKDKVASVWYSHNGERVGTYKGHNGSLWGSDVDYTTTKLITGSADSSAKLWDVEHGTELFTYNHQTSVRSVGFAMGDRVLFNITDAKMGKPAQIFIFDITEDPNSPPVKVMNVGESRIVTASWGPLNKHIYAGHENGDVSVWDWQAGKQVNVIKEHTGQITDLQFSADKSYFITSSKDHSAKLFDTESLQKLKTYQTERPVNSASVSNLKEHVILGGGQDASQVTTTSARAGKFEVRIYHKIFEEELGRVKGHFGPINTVAFSPDGRGFTSGGEDGYVRLHHFDPDYFDFEVEY